ncbi:hypothetical protein PENSPDRAFT_691345 [Peniophora sp. CONT]|nr:hypothetical protein PENSPDRAFT_691345 [Peniophora sp. CONT]
MKKRAAMLFNGSMFTGRETDDPVDFMRHFLQWALGAAMDDDTRVEAFETVIKNNTPANNWWMEWKDAQKTTYKWADVKSVFQTKYKPVARAKRTETDIVKELLALRLKKEDIGKKVKLGEADVWSHVAYAAKGRNLAQEAKIESSTSNLVTLHEYLPLAIRGLVPENQTLLTAFFKAVEDLDPNTLVTETAKAKEMHNDLMSSFADELRKLNLSAVHTPYLSQAGNFARAPQTGQSYNPPCQNTPPALRGQQLQAPTAEQRAHLERAATITPPNKSPEAFEKYARDMAAFTSRFGTNPYITYDTPVPLQPGGPKLASGECFNCGNTNHFSVNCPLRDQPGHQDRLPLLESRWRALVGTVLQNVNKPRTGNFGANILFLGSHEVGFNGWANTPGYEELEQGNTGGSA